MIADTTDIAHPLRRNRYSEPGEATEMIGRCS